MPHLPDVDDARDFERPRMTVKNLIALSFLWFPINLFWTIMLQNLLPSRVQDLVGDSVKGEYLGYISFAGAIATTVIQLVVAPLSDACASRWGRRHPFVFWGIVLNTFCVAGFALAQNFPLLMLSFFGIQLFLNIANGPYQALLPDNIRPDQQGVASAYMGMALLIGQLLGGILLVVDSLLHHPLGIGGMLVIITILLGVGAFVTLKGVPDRPAPPEEQLSAGEALATLTDLRVKENPDFFGLLYARFFVNLSYATVVAFLLYYLQDAVGIAKEKVGITQGILLLIATVAGLIGTLTAGRAMRTFSKKRIIYAASALIGVAALIFAFTKALIMVYLLGFLFGAGWGAFQAVDWAFAVSLLPRGGVAKYMAVWHVCMTVPQIIAPLFGRVADIINRQQGQGMGWRVAMLSTVVYLVIGTALLHRIRERDTRAEPIPAH